MKKYRKRIIIFGSIISFILLILVVFAIYFGSYYRAVDVESYLESSENVTVLDEGDLVFKPTGEIKAGLIFYPGAKVEYTSYSPLMYELAKEGIMCVLVEMPLNFAIFGVDKAKDIMSDYDEISKWYLMGHSLGGAMIASFAGENSENVAGLILLAAYSTTDVSSIDTLLIYGSNDLVLNKEKYEECKKNLSDSFIESIIIGGNHANFASYGKQKSDGEATISIDEQIDLTVQSIIGFIS